MELRKDDTLILVVPITEEASIRSTNPALSDQELEEIRADLRAAGQEDPIYLLGTDPINSGVDDASVNLDHYIYGV